MKKTLAAPEEVHQMSFIAAGLALAPFTGLPPQAAFRPALSGLVPE